MDELLVKSLWASASQSASSHAALMARSCHHRRAANLIGAAARQFIEQAPPDSSEELSQRRLQQLALSAIIAAVTHADSMAHLHPTAAEAVFDEVAKLCDGPLPATFEGVTHLHMACIALSATIQSLCSAAAMNRLIGAFKDESAFDEVARLGQELRHADSPE